MGVRTRKGRYGRTREKDRERHDRERVVRKCGNAIKVEIDKEIKKYSKK